MKTFTPNVVVFVLDIPIDRPASADEWQDHVLYMYWDVIGDGLEEILYDRHGKNIVYARHRPYHWAKQVATVWQKQLAETES